MSRSANRIPAVLPHSAAEIARQSLPTKFRFPDHEMERPKRGLSAFDDIERSLLPSRIGGLARSGRRRSFCQSRSKGGISWPLEHKPPSKGGPRSSRPRRRLEAKRSPLVGPSQRKINETLETPQGQAFRTRHHRYEPRLVAQADAIAAEAALDGIYVIRLSRRG